MARRLLNAGDDAQAETAALHLQGLENAMIERLEVNYPVSKLTPSPENPRRLSLDRASVNIDSITEVSIRPRESLDEWAARLERFLAGLKKRVDEDSFVVWSELFDLALSVYTSDLLQPIIARHDGVIIAGERRWTACQIAGKTHARVILRQVPRNLEVIYRLIENINRSNLSVAEMTISMREVFSETTGQPCGPDNRHLTAEYIRSIMGKGKTQCAYYRALCRLPDGDPLLQSLINGDFTSLRLAYNAASKRLRSLKVSSDEPEEVDEQTGVQPIAPLPAQLRKPKTPQLKIHLPGTEGGIRFIQAIESISGVKAETVERIQSVRNGWAAAPEKVRKKMLTEAIEYLFQDLEQLEEVEA